METVFGLKDVEAQLSEHQRMEVQGSIAAAEMNGALVRHKQGQVDLVIFPSGKMMRGDFLEEEA